MKYLSYSYREGWHLLPEIDPEFESIYGIDARSEALYNQFWKDERESYRKQEPVGLTLMFTHQEICEYIAQRNLKIK